MAWDLVPSSLLNIIHKLVERSPTMDEIFASLPKGMTAIDLNIERESRGEPSSAVGYAAEEAEWAQMHTISKEAAEILEKSALALKKKDCNTAFDYISRITGTATGISLIHDDERSEIQGDFLNSFMLLLDLLSQICTCSCKGK